MSDIAADEHTGRSVLVRWVDSGLAVHGWSTRGDLPGNVSTVESIGFWIGENDDVIAIAGTMTGGADFLNCQLVWKRAIMEKTWM